MKPLIALSVGLFLTNISLFSQNFIWDETTTPASDHAYASPAHNVSWSLKEGTIYPYLLLAPSFKKEMTPSAFKVLSTEFKSGLPSDFYAHGAPVIYHQMSGAILYRKLTYCSLTNENAIKAFLQIVVYFESVEGKEGYISGIEVRTKDEIEPLDTALVVKKVRERLEQDKKNPPPPAFPDHK